jgi:hypothetical protein
MNRVAVRRILTGGAIYLFLWGATQALGVPAIEQIIERDRLPHPISSPLAKNLDESREAVAVAPFIVIAHFRWTDGGMAGSGGKLIYLSVGTKGWLMSDSAVWMK